MAIDLYKIPTSNTLNLRITFFLQGREVASLGAGEAQTLELRFDRLRLGMLEPGDYYVQEYPQDIGIHPANLAFIDQSVIPKLALRYGTFGGTQQNIIFKRLRADDHAAE